MVRFVIAIACISVIFPSATAVAQTRTSGAKSPPPTGRADTARPSSTRPSGTQAQTATRPPGTRPPSTQAQSVSRSQPAEPRIAEQQSLVDKPDTGRATIEVKDEIINQQAPEMSPELVRELDRILEFWAAASDDINRLQGKHFRIVYDSAFEIEKQSEGEFAYEKSDKGRIDITPVQVTPELIAARLKEVETAKKEKRRCQVRLKADGTPFDLVMEQPERWSCDGQRVYSIDVEKKEAVVAQLPTNMQGKNIMDSPLPFLFGMPPDKAKRRFTLFFSGGQFDPNSGKARLTIYPRLPQDAQSWRQADVILDLKEFLPVAVQLLDPAGTKLTVYKFQDFKKNQKNLPVFLGGNPKTHFTPDLRDFNVQIVGDENPQKMVEGPPAQGESPPGNALANVGGLKHDEAVLQLTRQGLKRVKGEENQIILEAGPAATNPEDVFTVKSQDPAPGTPLGPNVKVKLVIWTEPKTASK